VTGSAAYSYGRYDDGSDPLAPPFDLGGTLDELGERVLDGASPRQALERLLRRGRGDRNGLDDLMRRVRQRQREARERGRLDGTLERVRELLDRAVEQERQSLFPDPSDSARLAEGELDALPADPARAVRELADYDWRSPEARATFEELQQLLRSEVLEQQFRGIKDALQQQDPAQMQRLKDMLADLNAMLEADARGEDTEQQFEQFMQNHGEFFPEQPGSLEELIESLARRAAAAERLMRSLSPQQRQELGDLIASAMEDMDLAAEMSRLNSALRGARPDLLGPRGQRGRGERMTGDEPLGLGDATSALEELAELDELAGALGQDYPGATLDDVDEDAVRRHLGRQAVDDVRELRRIEQELERQGFLRRRADGELELTPRAVRRLGATALRRIFRQVHSRGRGDHDMLDAGAAGEITGATRPWRFGDEQPLDVVRTIRNALLRGGPPGPGQRVRLHVDDMEVLETERRASACVCLLVDLSYSMALRGTWGAAKSTALALHSLVTSKHPQDAIYVIGFSNYAREVSPVELAGLDYEMVQGTNLQHALMIAGRRLAQHPDAEPIVLVVTDGEPTAHLLRDGTPWFAWPPLAETLELTLAEVDRLTRRGATVNVFMLDDDPRLVDFVQLLARRNGGRGFSPSAQRLGEYVVSDYLQARQGRRRAAG
jgi:uncharacterized protein with von Willebrand factor type A (vWA) domain